MQKKEKRKREGVGSNGPTDGEWYAGAGPTRSGGTW